MSAKQRVAWTCGNLFMLIGLLLLAYVGGTYADDAYNRAAARGDSALPLPVALVEDVRQDSPQAFIAPNLTVSVQAPSGSQAAPAQPRQSTVSRIQIPKIAVDSKVIEVGWTVENEVAVWQVAKYAVGQHRGSANPGEGSNTVLAGHVGGSAPVFQRLIEVAPGDQVILTSAGQQFLYVVREVQRVQEVGVSDEQRLANAAYMDPTAEEMVTIITCWPPAGPNAFDQRIVVRAIPYANPAVASDTSGASWSLR
ncbi:MAG TPA: sortase [Herpetosiphonaceae bacterium]|nr:sortase [Herpetosiphonaceae bacterium]